MCKDKPFFALALFVFAVSGLLSTIFAEMANKMRTPYPDSALLDSGALLKDRSRRTLGNGVDEERIQFQDEVNMFRAALWEAYAPGSKCPQVFRLPLPPRSAHHPFDEPSREAIEHHAEQVMIHIRTIHDNPFAFQQLFEAGVHPIVYHHAVKIILPHLPSEEARRAYENGVEIYKNFYRDAVLGM